MEHAKRHLRGFDVMSSYPGESAIYTVCRVVCVVDVLYIPVRVRKYGICAGRASPTRHQVDFDSGAIRPRDHNNSRYVRMRNMVEPRVELNGGISWFVRSRPASALHRASVWPPWTQPGAPMLNCPKKPRMNEKSKNKKQKKTEGIKIKMTR